LYRRFGIVIFVVFFVLVFGAFVLGADLSGFLPGFL
jgi:hypothetical protein